MRDLSEDLYELEHELATGDGDTYRAHLTDDAIVIVPGQAMNKDETVKAMDASPGWDEASLTERNLLSLAEGTALLSYRFEGRRGSDTYTALIGSVYVRAGDEWKLGFHQQTPLSE